MINCLKNEIEECKLKYDSELEKLSKSINDKKELPTIITKEDDVIIHKKVIKKNVDNIVDIEIETDKDDETEYIWNESILQKIKKYSNNKEKLIEIRDKKKIPTNIFNQKLREISNEV